MEPNDASAATRKFTRQKQLVTVLAVLMIVLGILVGFVFRKLPLPLRITAGLGDVFVGCVLLVLVRQQR